MNDFSEVLELVNFGCGCIGFKKPTKEGRFVIIQSCQSDDDVPYFFTTNNILPRNVEKAVPLDEEQTKALIEKINSYIVDGSKFRQIRSLIK